MKTRIFILTLLLLAAVNFIQAQPRIDVGVNFGFFYEKLSPQGEWLQIGDGINGWRPFGVSRDWRPYSLGRWTWTEDGWYWDSYEPFGWATYHYGRWTYDDYYGWIWIPDYEWAPSWVEWRYDNDYIGWAPLPPYAGFRAGFGISFSFGWHSPFSHWNFVRFNHFCHNRVYDYYIDRDRVNYIFERTKYRTNYFDRDHRIINGGVDRAFVERRMGERIRETSFRSTSDLRDVSRNSAGRDSYVRVFRPSEDDVRKTRDIEVKNITRPERNISLQRDRIAIGASRDNNRQMQRPAENNNDRSVNRSGNPAADANRTVIRNDRSENEARAVERAKQNNERMDTRNNRDIQRREAQVRDNNARQEKAAQRSEINRNRPQQQSVRQMEKSAPRQERAVEKKAPERKAENSRSGEERRR